MLKLDLRSPVPAVVLLRLYGAREGRWVITGGPCGAALGGFRILRFRRPKGGARCSGAEDQGRQRQSPVLVCGFGSMSMPGSVTSGFSAG
jgi:hypothetical protein